MVKLDNKKCILNVLKNVILNTKKHHRVTSTHFSVFIIIANKKNKINRIYLYR